MLQIMIVLVEFRASISDARSGQPLAWLFSKHSLLSSVWL